MVCGGWQGHVHGLQLLGNMHSGVDAAQLLLAVSLQSCSCLQQHHTAVSPGVRLSQEPPGGAAAGSRGGKGGKTPASGNPEILQCHLEPKISK